MNQTISEIDAEIGRLATREGEIDCALYDLMPVRARTGAPIQYEDYAGEVGRQKIAEWTALMAEKTQVQSQRHVLFDELSRLCRPRVT